MPGPLDGRVALRHRRRPPRRGEAGELAEVAEVIGWLCTDAARLVSGTVLRLR